jgi:soluble lytic murein transglycosylase
VTPGSPHSTARQDASRTTYYATGSTRNRSRPRGGGRRRGSVRRRRRLVAVVGAIAAIVLLVAAVSPLFNQAVRGLTLPLSHQDVIRAQAADKHLDPALIAAVIYAETKFNPRTSPAGAEGLMQILPATAHFIAHLSGGTRFTTGDLATPSVNVAYGSYYLRYLLDHYHGNEMPAIAAYNAGLANVDQWVARAQADGARMQISAIPFPETQAYVQRVLQAQKDYRADYPHELGLSR